LNKLIISFSFETSAFIEIQFSEYVDNKLFNDFEFVL
jgi:hypothetical protein